MTRALRRTIGVALAGLVAAAPCAGRDLRDLYFGEALYHAHQGQYFEALERLDAELGQLGHVRLEPQVGQDACVDPRVQRLHPAVEALGEAGELLDRRDRHTCGLDGLGRRAGRHDRDTGGVEVAGELVEAGLVVHRHEGAAERSDVGHEVSSVFVL
jgi:hypothetical protein